MITGQLLWKSYGSEYVVTKVAYDVNNTFLFMRGKDNWWVLPQVGDNKLYLWKKEEEDSTKKKKKKKGGGVALVEVDVTLEIKKEVWGLKYDHKKSFPRQKIISK